VLTLGGARQKQRDDVRAGDEQEERDGAEEQPKRPPRSGDSGFFKGVDCDREIVCLGKLPTELGLDGGEIGTSLRRCDAGLQASGDDKPVVFASPAKG